MDIEGSAIVTARVSTETKTKLDALARSTRRSKSYLAAEAIAAYVEQNAWQIDDIEAGLAELDAGKGLSEAEGEKQYGRIMSS